MLKKWGGGGGGEPDAAGKKACRRGRETNFLFTWPKVDHSSAC